jgi:hypothetical protein
MQIDVECFPARLPVDERVLWQGRPSWKALALQGFHLRWLAAYFAILLAWFAGTEFTSHEPVRDAALSTLRMTGIALVPLLLVCLYAWMTAVTTIYTITDRRVVMRIGGRAEKRGGWSWRSHAIPGRGKADKVFCVLATCAALADEAARADAALHPRCRARRPDTGPRAGHIGRSAGSGIAGRCNGFRRRRPACAGPGLNVKLA